MRVGAVDPWLLGEQKRAAGGFNPGPERASCHRSDLDDLRR